jgi:hypothetical protein
MKKMLGQARPELLGGLISILLAGMLFAFGQTPTLIDELSNYPNPFDSRREGTTITYRLPQDIPVHVRIYDLFGYPVKEFSFNAGEMGARAGVNEIQWDGTDGTGSKVSKGGYICRVTVEGDRPVNGIRKIGVIH